MGLPFAIDPDVPARYLMVLMYLFIPNAQDITRVPVDPNVFTRPPKSPWSRLPLMSAMRFELIFAAAGTTAHPHMYSF